MSVTNAFHVQLPYIYFCGCISLHVAVCGVTQALLRNGADVKFYVVVGQDARATHLKTYTLEV